MRAGAAEATITPALGTHLSGYRGRGGPADTIHDELRAIALVFEAGGTRIALLACDLVGLPAPLVREWRGYWAERTGVPAAHILVSCTHTHAGPPTGTLEDPENPVGEREGAYLEHLKHALSGALEAATSGLRPACLRVGETRCRIQRNRRDRLPGPHGPLDDTLDVLCVEQLNETGSPGGPLATVVKYACHPVTLRQHNLGLSADYVESVRRAVTETTGTPCLFLQGACGDLVPDLPRLGTPGAPGGISPAVSDQLGVTRRIGRIVGDAAVQALPDARQAAAEADVGVAATVRTLDVSLGASREDEKRDEQMSLLFEVQCLRLGDLAIIGLPVEPFNAVGLAMRRLARTGGTGPRVVWCAGYANGCHGYLAPADEHPRGGYEIQNAHRYYKRPAPFPPDTVDRVVAAGGEALGELFPLVSERRAPPE